MIYYPNREDYRIAWDKAYEQDPPVPLNIDIELASACNAKCSFCLYGDREWDKSMMQLDWDGKQKKRLMPTALAIELIGKASELGITAVKFNFRGESLMHPDYGMIVKYAENQGGYVDSMQRHMFRELLANTNGNIPFSNWDSGISGLMKCTKVMISLDSMDETIYPKIRVGLSLDSAKRTIDELVRLNHPDLWVRRVICKANKEENFVDAVKERWPRGVKVSEHYAFDRNHYQDQELTGEDPATWERTYCGYPSQRIVVEASGRYVPCCIAWGGEFDAGKYPEVSLKEYWESEWRRNLANELRNNVFKNDKCKNCTSFMSYKRPEREFVRDKEATA